MTLHWSGLRSFFAASLVATGSLGVAGSAHAAELPAGADIADGLAVHVTPKGVDFLESQIANLIPPTVGVANQQGNLFSCLFDTCVWRLRNTVVTLDVGKVSLTPLEGRLQLHLELWVSATARVETNGCLFNNGCNVVLDPSLVIADTTIEMQLVPDGTGRFDIDAETEAFDIQLDLGDPDINNCLLGNFLEFFVELFLGNIEDAVVGVLEDQVRPLIEPAIEDAFNSLNIAGSFDIAGAAIGYDFYPTRLELHPGTIGVVMGGHFASETVAPCADPDRGSLLTVGALPDYSQVPSQYDLAGSIADDILNQLLFSAWRSGLLCRTVDEMGGAPLSSDLLAMLGGSLSTIMTDGGPLALQITTPEPPIATLGGPNGETAVVSLANMRLDVFADVRDRMVRIFGLTLSPTAGVTLTMGADGVLVPELNFDPTQMGAQVAYNELAPDVNETLLTLLPTILEQFLPQLTDAIPPIALPDLGGIVLESADFTPDGPAGDYLTAHASLGGQVSAGGCSAIPDGGCGVDAGGLGCSIKGNGRRGRGSAATLFATPVMLLVGIGSLLVRRRNFQEA